MPNTSMVQLIKKAALDAFQASRPCDYRTGTVISTNPLQVKLSQTMILDRDFLDIARNVTDYVTEIETDYGTPEAAVRYCQVRNGLKNGEKVLLVRKQGGQKYAVIDRMVGE